MQIYVEGFQYVKPDLCGPCGGKCCKTYPGMALPEEFGAPDMDTLFAQLVAVFRSGKWAIDGWEGDPRSGHEYGDHDYISMVYFVRPAVVGESKLYDYTWGGRCVFLGDSGCELPHAKRPAVCRALEPGMDRCTPHLGKQVLPSLGSRITKSWSVQLTRCSYD